MCRSMKPIWFDRLGRSLSNYPIASTKANSCILGLKSFQWSEATVADPKT